MISLAAIWALYLAGHLLFPGGTKMDDFWYSFPFVLTCLFVGAAALITDLYLVAFLVDYFDRRSK